METNIRASVKSNQDRMVICHDGSSHPRSKCRVIKKLYYLIGDVNKKDSGHCYLIDGTYYIDGPRGKVFWDYEKNVYTTNTNLITGFIDNKGTIGKFSPNPFNNIIIEFNESTGIGISINILPPKYGYDYGNGIYRINSNISYSNPRILPRKPSYHTLSTSNYGFADAPGVVEDITNHYETYKQKNIKPSIFDKFFGNHKFGLEIETESGWLPELYYYRYGALPLRDGSIAGTEITTIPYTTDKIFNTLLELTTACNKFTGVNQNNSLHVNIGNVKNSPNFRVALWNLYTRLEHEIENIIPPYKRNLMYFDEKRGMNHGQLKDHCKAMPKLGLVKRYDSQNQIEEADETIRQFLNEGHRQEKYVREGDPKWNHRTRYYVLNMLPLYFSKKAPRVEYRFHSGTVNPIKTILWTLICEAITLYAEDNHDRILNGREKILLSDVIHYATIEKHNETPESVWLYTYIIEYMRARTHEHVSTSMTDQLYGREFQNDNNYIFTFDGLNLYNYEKKRT